MENLYDLHRKRTARKDCIVEWNGWFRQLKKGDRIEQFEEIVPENQVPENIFWSNGLGMVVN